ncbi:hypothetical protein FSST1_012764 [Fusarium sambucinum]
MDEATFYPGSKAFISARVEGLMTSINIHLEAIETKADDAKGFEGVIKNNIDLALKEQGLSSIEDLESSLGDQWNDRLRGENEKMLKRIGKEAADVASCVKIVSYIGMVAFGIGLTAEVIDIFKYGTAILGSKLVGRSLIKVANKEFAAGLRLMRRALKLKRSVRGTGNGAKVIKGIKRAGGAIAILSVIGDSYMSVYSLAQGGQHRQQLQDAIRDLCARRFSVKYIQDLHVKYRSFLQSMYTAVKTDRVMKKKQRAGTITQEDYNQRMKDVIEGIAEDLKDQCKNVTFDKVYGELAREDDRNKAWTAEDLKKDELQDRWESGEIKQFLSKEANDKIEEEGGKVMLAAEYNEDDDDDDEDLDVPDDEDCSSEDDCMSDDSDDDD